MSGKILLPHTCPKCRKVVAKTYQELEEKFSLRNITSPSGEVNITNQTWCRECRSKSNQKEKE